MKFYPLTKSQKLFSKVFDLMRTPVHPTLGQSLYREDLQVN
jgi:hypothetical protein